MPGDYPDYTDLMQIIGSDIMIPIDLQAAYVMMPVDIQAQYVTLEIDIVAQTVGNISIDIAAQTVGNIGIDLKAQTIGNLDIDIDAQTVGVYLQPEWAAKEEIDKNFSAFGAAVVPGDHLEVTYTPTDGKTLYLCGVSFSIGSNMAADRDKHQVGMSRLRNNTDTLTHCWLGGNGGGGLTFPKPIAFPTNKQMSYYCINYTNHNCNIGVSAWGYEL